MIKLTKTIKEKTSIWVNPNHISTFYEYVDIITKTVGHTVIRMNNVSESAICVVETPEQIVELINNSTTK